MPAGVRSSNKARQRGRGPEDMERLRRGERETSENEKTTEEKTSKSRSWECELCSEDRDQRKVQRERARERREKRLEGVRVCDC